MVATFATPNTLARQVRALELHGNWSSDWSLVRVSRGKNSATSGIPAGRVRGCFFHGPVQLGDLSGEVGNGHKREE